MVMKWNTILSCKLFIKIISVFKCFQYRVAKIPNELGLLSLPPYSLAKLMKTNPANCSQF